MSEKGNFHQLEEGEGEEEERNVREEKKESWWKRLKRTGEEVKDIEMTDIGEEKGEGEGEGVGEGSGDEHALEEEEGRQRWNSRLQFFLASIGFAVGVGNVWRFPYLCYRNGGGAFLIPYFITLVVLALPIFTLELYLGNLCQRGPCSLFLRKIPKTVRFGGVGIASAVTSFFVVCYYNVILAWSLCFFVYSFRNPLPWEEDADFFYDFVLQRSDSIDDTGGLVWQLTLALLIAGVIIFLSVFQGVKWSGRVVMVTVTTPYILLIILFFKGITLEGAWEGIKFYLTPDFSRLFELDIWVAAANQVFFSLSPAWGVAITFGSYLPLDEPVAKDALWIALINSATSIFAGFVIFSVLGHMSWQTGIPVDKVAIGGPELAFIVYPEALSLLPYPYVFSVMFFAMMMLLGIDSAFAIVELLIASLQETKWLRLWRKQFLAGIIVFFAFLGGLALTTRAGIYWVDLIDHFVPLFSLFTIGLIELICVAWWWPLDNFLKSLEINRGRKIPFENVWFYLWKYITPGLLCLMILMTLFNEIKVQYGGYPPWAQLVGWIIAFIPLGVIALFFVLKKGKPMHKRAPKKKRAKKTDSTPKIEEGEEEEREEEEREEERE